MNPRHLGDILPELVDALGIRAKLKRQEVLTLWPEVVGERVAKVTRAREVRDGRLFVEVESSAWRNELFYLKREIIQQLNNRAGEEVVHDLVFV